MARLQWAVFIAAMSLVAGTTTPLAQTPQIPLVVRANDLTDPSYELPKNVQALAVDLDRVNKVIDDIELFQTNPPVREFNSVLKKNIDNLKNISDKIKAIDCQGADWTSQERELSREYNGQFSVLIGNFSSLFRNTPSINFNTMLINDPVFIANGSQSADNCKNFIANLKGSTDKNRDEFVLDLQTRISDSAKQFDDENNSLKSLTPKLREFRLNVEKAMDKYSSSAVSNISERVPVILGIIGAACLGVFFGLKLFGTELQLEWVASGQIIQFMTVMILLSVIMALGLAEILKETTLGTLLGGVAGYVLAQGVGRQAARDASRGPPPPPPPPHAPKP